jgi:hypothetical protein
MALLDTGDSSERASSTSADTTVKRGPGRMRAIALLVMTATLVALTGCATGAGKDYDIAPIFPLSANKCAKYDGKTTGSGFASHCWVTKSKCQQAAADWHQAMRQGGINDAIEIRC